MGGEAGAPGVAFGVLGPLTASTEEGPLALKGPRHRAVLARLLIAQGRVVPVDRLVADLWEDPPEGAVGVVQTFVSALRRALEPDRAPRRPARLLVTAAPGYALRAAPGAVDAVRFTRAVQEAGALLGTGRPAEALDLLDAALALWRGPAYAEFAEAAWARAEADRLDGMRLLAVERRAEALLGLGRAAEAVPDLRAHTREHPLREDAWQLLVLAHYRSGGQGEALAALRQARRVLAAELGADPGPGLRRLEADVLHHAPHLTPTAAAPAPGREPGPGPGREPRPGPGREPAQAPSPPAVLPAAAASSAAPRDLSRGRSAVAGRPFVGRTAELAALEQAAAAAVRDGRLTTALVSGGAGAGKTALAEALTDLLAARGWHAAWGRSPAYEGAPATWPWTQITRALADGDGDGPGTDPGTDSDTGADPQPTSDGVATARFRAHRTAASRLAAASARRPVLVVLDDLHRAGEETLDLLTALAADPVPGPVLLVGTHRSTGIPPGLTEALARLARAEPVRVYAGGLPEQDTAVLVRGLLRRDVDARTVRVIHRRSGGNPFFVRELARLVDAEGPGALDAVPAGVRDVIRHRLTRLPEAVVTVLRQAAVLGGDLDTDVLAVLAERDGGLGEPALFDALEAALAAGFLTDTDTDTNPDTDPDTRAGTDTRSAAPARGGLRFAHVLVRDTLYDGISAPRRARWHTAAGEALEQLAPDGTAALAHHFCRAGTRATAGRAARYARAAAEQAERRFAPHEAAGLWRQALDAHDRAGGGDGRKRLETVMGLVRALAVTGRLAGARQHRAEAVAAAEALGDPRLTAEVIGAFDVPALWTRNDDERLAGRLVQVTERTLAALPGGETALRSRLLSTLALELRGAPGDRGRRAAHEAEALARRADDPALLAFALNGRFMQVFDGAGTAPARDRLGAELVDLSRRHDLVTFEVLGHLVRLQASAALADLTAADGHAAATDRLAERHDIPLAGVFTRWYAALRAAVAGRAAEAETAYRTASTALAGAGMPGLEQGLLPLALFCLHTQTGRPPPWDPAAAWGPHAPWVRPAALLAAGRPEQAARALREAPDPPPDLLYEARLCLLAVAAVGTGDLSAAARLRAALLPAEEELAGAGSGLLTLGPVARHLGDLAVALGYREAAAAHYRRAARVAQRAGAAHWEAAAGAALARTADAVRDGSPDGSPDGGPAARTHG